jgi:hypothetical protein
LIPCGGIGGRLTLQAVPVREAEPTPGVVQIAAAGLQMARSLDPGNAMRKMNRLKAEQPMAAASTYVQWCSN